MKSFLAIFSLLIGIYQPQAFSAAPPVQPESKTTGDIDMNQFQGLDAKPRNTAEEKIRTQLTCTDEQGHLIKKGERGFDTCISNSQARILKTNQNPEAPDDARKR